MPTARLDTPTGPFFVTVSDGAVTRASWRETEVGGEDTVLTAAIAQLEAYFAGELTAFDLPLRIAGSDLQRAVCAEMRAIPFGETTTYGMISRKLGVPAQAIGQACGGNPVPIIIPCHRVLGTNGLGGFSGEGGVETKVALLRHEGAAGLLI